MKIEVNVNEINLILMALAELPYKQVALLLPKLQAQAQQQIEHQALESEDAVEWQSSTT